MRNISFFLTTQQIRERTKTVTRRLGWTTLQPGTLLRAVVKSQGLRKGERVEPLATIRVTAVSREPLRRLQDDLYYGFSEVEREGFEEVNGFPSAFVDFFCRSHTGCTFDTIVTRIEFDYLD